MRFFTINLKTDLLKEIEFNQLTMTGDEKKQIRKQNKDIVKTQIFENILTPYEMLSKDPDFITMRQDIYGN